MKEHLLIAISIIFLLLAIILFIVSCSLIKQNKKVERINPICINEFIPSTKNSKRYIKIQIIGNSITYSIHSSYWWGKWGMAATKKENDFIHLLIKNFSQDKNVILDIMSSYIWEVNSHDRAEETLLSFLPNIKEDANYIILQFGENMNDWKTLNADLTYLIVSLKNKCKSAKIIIVGNFWKNDEIDSIKQSVSHKLNVQYVDLSEIQDKEEYYAGQNTVVTGDDGEKHIIEHQGVAIHPNDKAMMYIADKIYEKINKN